MLLPPCFTRLSTYQFAARGLLLAATLAISPALRAQGTSAPTEEKLVADGMAILREWQPPIYPAAELKSRTSGMVTVRLIVDENGVVTSARALEDSDAPFVDSAIAAVKSWVFAAAIEDGKPIASCLETLVTFSPSVGQQRAPKGNIPPKDQRFTSAPRTSPRPLVTPDGHYPAVLTERKLPGEVVFSCTVSPEGRAVKSKILATSHADFVLPALEALQRWEFSPGMWGDLPALEPVEGRMTFDTIAGSASEIYEANGLSAPDGSPAPISPHPIFMADPVWPIDRLLAGESGSATVEFTVGQSGKVRDVFVRDTSEPEYGAALAAAVATWQFDRPMAQQGTTVTLMKRAEYAAVVADASTDAPNLARLVHLMKAGGIAGAKGLDEKLTPLHRIPPVYPAALAIGERPVGRAEIEFIIDREGRARLPRIVSATHPEFGWAAATAVSQWVFKAPARGGEPVDVKVKIPFEFSPPQT